MGDVNNAIIEKIQVGDSYALQELLEVNRGLAAHIARRYLPLVEQRNDIDLDDLVQSGYIGMIATAGKYDPERDMKFSSFAVYFIKKEIRRTFGILYSKDKRDPLYGAVSLDTPLDADDADSATLSDIIAAEEEPDRLEDEALRETVRAAVDRIENDKTRGAIEEFYWKGKTEEQIAEDRGVSKQSINDRLHKGYDELKRDKELHQWAVDFGLINVYRHKGVRAFKTSFSSVVEDIVIQAEERYNKNKMKALSDVLGNLL